MSGSELLLTIDTSTAATGIAVSRGETLLGEISLRVQGARTERLLLQNLARLLADLDLRPEMFAAFAAVVGPGSFTGLRVGIATVKGMAMAVGRPVLGISSLRNLAVQAGYSREPVCALLDARKKEVYAGLYDCSGAFPELLGTEMVLPPDRLVERLPDRVLLVGDGADLCRRSLEGRPGTTFLPWSFQAPRAGHAAALALADLRQGKGLPPAALVASYIRRSEAEILYDRRGENSLIEG